MSHRPMFIALLFAAATSLAAQQPSHDPIEGRWAGGWRQPGDYMSITLDFKREGTGYTGTISLPFRGNQAPLQAEYDAPDLVVTAGFGSSVLTLRGQVADGVFTGAARRSDRLGLMRFELVRVIDVDERTLEGYVGEYMTPTGTRLSLGRLQRATDTVLTASFEKGGARILFPVSPSEWIAGPHAKSPHPIETRLTVERDGNGRVTSLRWRTEEGIQHEGTRLHLTFDEKRIVTHIDHVLQALHAPSISVGIVHDQELVLAHSVGVMHRETRQPATPDTLYQIASVTKTFTALLLAILADDGTVDLDAPVAQYLPAEVILPTPSPTGDRAITLRHLLTHTAGLPQQPINYVFEGRNNNNYTVSLLYEGLRHTKHIAPIGDRHSYSNLGYVLLGHAMARAAGTSFEQLIQDKIFTPLGMVDSTITLSEEDLARLATHYWSDRPQKPEPPWIPGDIAAQGGISSSVRDMARYLSLQFRADRIDAGPVSGALLREVQRPLRQVSSTDRQIAYAWFTDETPESGRILYHNGFTGGHSSWVGFSPSHRVGVVILTNFGFEPIGRLGPWLLHEAVRSAREQRLPTRDEADRSYLAGDWSHSAWAYGVLTDNGGDDGQSLYRLGSSLWHLRRFAEAAEFWQQAARENYSPGTSLFNAAQARLFAGDERGALDLLESASRNGFRDYERYETDVDLERLRSNPRFVELIEGLKADGR